MQVNCFKRQGCGCSFMQENNCSLQKTLQESMFYSRRVMCGGDFEGYLKKHLAVVRLWMVICK